MNKKVQLNIVLILAFFLSGCGDGSVAQDKAFISKLKEHLKEKGDIVKVADIHSGDWEKVCFQPMSAYAELTGPEKIINRKRSGTWSDDDRWGIYFIYPGNKAEYYRIFRKEIHNNGVNSKDGRACITQKKAFFEVTGDYRRRRNVHPEANVSNDFINLILTQNGK